MKLPSAANHVYDQYYIIHIHVATAAHLLCTLLTMQCDEAFSMFADDVYAH
jgi:hypothetical protein